MIAAILISYVVGAIATGITIQLNFEFEFIPAMDELEPTDELGVALIILWPVALPIIAVVFLIAYKVYTPIYNWLEKRGENKNDNT